MTSTKPVQSLQPASPQTEHQTNTLPLQSNNEEPPIKRPQSFFSTVFSSHKAFGRKNLFTTSGNNDDKIPDLKSGKSHQSFLSSVISSNQGILTDLSSKLEAALSLGLEALDSDSSTRSEEMSFKTSMAHELSNSSSQTDVRRFSLPSSNTEQMARHRYTKRRHKDRSVYGQPEINPFDHKTKSRKTHSLESLDTVDSGQSLGSLSASGTECRISKTDPFYVFRHPESIGIGSESDLCGQSTSLDSSDAESIPESRSFYFGRSGSGSSLHSWASSPSNDSQPDDVTLDAMEFMKHFVQKIFNDCTTINFEEKAKFGELCRHEIGRIWFSRSVNCQRVHNKVVKESTFFSLIQYFAIVLFECAEADDFSPAKSIMNMCFTFYYENKNDSHSPSREYLFSFLKDQPIWQSIRFWNAAFFDAVQCERANREIPTRDDIGHYSAEDLRDEKNFQENIFFGQLGTFTYNMYAFGLSKKFAMAFLRKQCTIASLSKEHVVLLKENIDRMYSGAIGKECS